MVKMGQRRDAYRRGPRRLAYLLSPTVSKPRIKLRQKPQLLVVLFHLIHNGLNSLTGSCL